MCSMRNSLVTRVTSAYALLAGTLVVFTCLVSVAFALHEGVVKVDSLLSNRRAELRDTADALAVDGRPFRDIARVMATNNEWASSFRCWIQKSTSWQDLQRRTVTRSLSRWHPCSAFTLSSSRYRVVRSASRATPNVSVLSFGDTCSSIPPLRS